MRSWGVLVTIAMGFLFGLVFAGIGGISAGLQASEVSQQADYKLKINKIEEYWAKADIQKADLLKIVNDRQCHSSEKYFLACVNSVVSSLQKLNQRLSSTGEILATSEGSDNLDNFTERENILPFTQIYSEKLNHTFKFEKIWNEILSNNKKSYNIPEHYLYALGMNGFLSVYRDPHTYILPIDYFTEVTASSERSPYFVGLSFDKKNGKTYIRKVFKNSDAYHAGLKSADQILSLNGQLVQKLNLAEISQILKDRNIKSFSFVIARNGVNYVKNLQRSYRRINQVYSEVIEGIRNTGLVQVSKFSKGTCDEVKKDILKMAKQDISGLILDLRDNPGGHLSEAACLAGLFLGIDKKIYSVKYFDSTKDIEVALTTAEQVYSGPLVVLTSNSSASAAELIAGAFQEYHRGIIIGERTFGKGTFQESEAWLNKKDIGLFKTKGFYLLPSGASTQFFGVTPDIKLNDGNSLTSESKNYVNPVKPEAFQLNGAQKTSVKLPFSDCLQSQFGADTKDIFINQALQVLSCRAVTSNLANLFSTDEFN